MLRNSLTLVPNGFTRFALSGAFYTRFWIAN